jgi:argininosuccinate lyase
LMVTHNESIYFDRAIYAQDIRGSIAYSRGNSKIGILTQEEFAAIEKGFKQVETEWESGKFDITPGVDMFTQPMIAGLVRSSVLALQGSCILAGVVMIK